MCPRHELSGVRAVDSGCFEVECDRDTKAALDELVSRFNASTRSDIGSKFQIS